MKILILGSSGILGRKLYSNLKKHFKTVHTGLLRRKFNIEKTIKIKNILEKEKPNLVINCLAIADIEKCEKQKKYTYNQ